MTNVYEILRELEETTKRTKKLEILNRHKDNPQLKRVFYLTLHPKFNFGIEHFDDIIYTRGDTDLETALEFLENKLATREVTGNEAKNQLMSVIEKLTVMDQQIVLDILSRNLRVGVSTSTVNKVWPGLIETCDFMLAKSDAGGLIFPDVVCQVKYDGMRVHATLEGDSVVFQTRNSSKFTAPDHLIPEIKQIIKAGEFIDGELVCFTKDNLHEDRQTGNGILNKLIQGTCSPEETATVHFIVWDVVNRNERIPYATRLYDLNKRIDKTEEPLEFIHPVEQKMTNTPEQLTEYFNLQLEKGREGIVAKNMFHLWQPKRSPDWVKFKAIKTADLRVVQIIPGKGKYTGMMGALEIASDDGAVKTSVGTGFSDAQRELLNSSRIIGQIVEVAYNSIIHNKDSTTSLYLPRFIKFRTDKSTTTTKSEF